METKNVLIAVILSTIILIVWATFFEAPPTKQISEAQTAKHKKHTQRPLKQLKHKKKFHQLQRRCGFHPRQRMGY